MAGEEQIKIGLLGIGVIGSGVARNLQDREETYAQQTGLRLSLHRVLERHRWKAEGAGVDPAILSDDAPTVLGDKTIDIIIALLGGEHPAYDFIKEALLSRRHVVTANKEVMAKHGSELLALANDQGGEIRL